MSLVPRLRTAAAVRALLEDEHPTRVIVRRLEALGHNPATVYSNLSRFRRRAAGTLLTQRTVVVRLPDEVWQRVAARAAEEGLSIALTARLILTRASRTLSRTDLTP